MDLVRRVRAALPPRSSIIVYTGRELDGGAKRDLGALADRVISKGARSPARLMKALDALLGGERGGDSGPVGRGTGSEGQTRLAGRRVLLIDDERNVFALRCALEERGVEVVVGMSGREGLSELMLDPDFDLVLLDIMMPEMDGYAVMAEIRGNPATCCLPVIALTANALKGDNERCIAAGADDWLSKPVSVERLVSLLGQWMR
jgi:CheY-like chemotaxis protein